MVLVMGRPTCSPKGSSGRGDMSSEGDPGRWVKTSSISYIFNIRWSQPGILPVSLILWGCALKGSGVSRKVSRNISCHWPVLPQSPPHHAIEQREEPWEEPQYSISLTHLFVVPPTLQGLPHLLTNCGWLSPLELQDGEARDPYRQPRTQRSS